jgi:hypothetical protein
MPWHVRLFAHTDLFLINRVFMPLAWWIDWRFHRSPYQQAYVVLQVAMGFNLLGGVWMALRLPWWLGIVTVFGAGLMAYVSRFWFDRLKDAQRQFDKDPATLCYAQMFFMAPPFSWARLFYLIAGAVIVGPNLTDLIMRPSGRHALDFVFSHWMVLCGVALYLAGAFPPQRPRREKKAAMALQPAMSAAASH